MLELVKYSEDQPRDEHGRWESVSVDVEYVGGATTYALSEKASRLAADDRWTWEHDLLPSADGQRLAGFQETQRGDWRGSGAAQAKEINSLFEEYGLRGYAFAVQGGIVTISGGATNEKDYPDFVRAAKDYLGGHGLTDKQERTLGRWLGFPKASTAAYLRDKAKWNAGRQHKADGVDTELTKAKRPRWTPADKTVKEFAQRVTPSIRASFTDGAKAAIGDANLGIDWDWVEPKAQQFARERGAELVGRRIDEDGKLIPNPSAYWAIDETTRAEVNELLDLAVEEGWSLSTFERELKGMGTFEDWRADTIARTELARAQNMGRAAAYREGDVEYVVIFDGDYDEECAMADGETWTVEEFEENPLEHPNCLRSARPATREEIKEYEEESDDEYEERMDAKREDIESRMADDEEAA